MIDMFMNAAKEIRIDDNFDTYLDIGLNEGDIVVFNDEIAIMMYRLIPFDISKLKILDEFPLTKWMYCPSVNIQKFYYKFKKKQRTQILRGLNKSHSGKYLISWFTIGNMIYKICFNLSTPSCVKKIILDILALEWGDRFSWSYNSDVLNIIIFNLV